jgi:D-proline reductase (dithiol) PrdB
MSVDSYKYLPRSFRQGYEFARVEVPGPVWSPLARPVSEARIALLTSAGLYLKDSQAPFDEERERANPLWGDPTYRIIPRDVKQEQIAASHLHLNTRDFYLDFNVALPIHRFLELEAEGRLGRLADENYSFMGYQERSCSEWRQRYGPEVARRLEEAHVDALVLAPA